ncbi:hypothetical protein [Streptomyces sp. PH10-H1]|uniref:DUF7848 domain-containing protein n=1 Tax=Streptomyces sp. PH10-H1 TaxID=3046212 RepID=UPI0024B8C517|nr:hypothetical protein [Streptomyces sp. PH10-H1]MDJ0342521.1 hypothetical protein [Streptomyces sp. PH10-H1]
MGTTTTMRFRNYEIKPDATGQVTIGMACVSGDDCTESSGRQTEPEKVGKWAAQHMQDTGHTRFQRRYSDRVTVELGEWL